MQGQKREKEGEKDTHARTHVHTREREKERNKVTELEIEWVGGWMIGKWASAWVNKSLCERERDSARDREASLTWYTSNRDMNFQTLQPPAPVRDPLPRTAKSSGAVSRSSFPPAAPASRCHVGHRSHMWPLFRVNSSFSSVIRCKRRQKRAVQHCPRHNLVTWAYMLISALLNVPLGALLPSSFMAGRQSVGTCWAQRKKGPFVYQSKTGSNTKPRLLK